MAEENKAVQEMPRYKCHKVVQALKIAIVAPLIDDLPSEAPSYVDGATITPYEKGFAPFEVSQEYLDKHKPQADGYYVVYEDGYESYSPAQAFEAGYTLIE